MKKNAENEEVGQEPSHIPHHIPYASQKHEKNIKNNTQHPKSTCNGFPAGWKLGKASRNAPHQHALVDLFHFAHGQAAGSGKASTFFLFFCFF